MKTKNSINLHWQDLKNKRLAIIGLGIENQAMMEYLLKKKLPCSLVIFDKKAKADLPGYKALAKYKNVSWELGKYYPNDLSGFDVVVRSPGSWIHKDKKVKHKGAAITTAMDLFLHWCPSRKIIGVTGTKGKGTTASLIFHILQTAKKRVWLGGNIGIAPFAFLEKIKTQDWVVLELSSFQLEDASCSPHLAVLTNFSAEHLAPADPNNPNYHKTMSEYWQAKLTIAKFQTKKDYLIANQKLRTRLIRARLNTKIKYFGQSDLPSQLPGVHNQENIAAATAVAQLVGISQADIKNAVASFQGLIYRIQLIRDLRGVKYYNDSFATTPEATMTAINSFGEPIVLIAGGADKGSDFKQLAKLITKRVKFVALLKGQGTAKLLQALKTAKYPKEQMVVFSNLKSVVKTASAQAQLGEVVLLSTACASFGMFNNYKERGKMFTELVKHLK